MDQAINTLLDRLPTLVLVLVIAISLYLLGKGADLLIEQAVSLSLHWGVPKIIIGATIISIGTTLPEASVSVLAAFSGQSEMALGNGIGSIIANTGLILGLAIILGTIPVDRKLVMRQGLIMTGATILLTIISLPFLTRAPGGLVSQASGIILVILLILYIFTSISWSRKGNLAGLPQDPVQGGAAETIKILPTLLKGLVSLVLILVSSKFLISSVGITAERVGIPQGIIAATLVAFGTSLPELIMSLRSVRKGHGELALGNVVGANILNVLFVIGTSAAVTSSGLVVPTAYYRLHFPTLLLMTGLFLLATLRRRQPVIHKHYGIILVLLYLVYILINFI